MDSFRFDRFTRSFSAPQSRRGALRSLLGAGALGVVPALAPGDEAAAFKTLSGCKKRCKKAPTATCRARCNRCCKKVLNGNQNRCDFGCGFIKTK